jgi:predicted naringenin-chalcone synthase
MRYSLARARLGPSAAHQASRMSSSILGIGTSAPRRQIPQTQAALLAGSLAGTAAPAQRTLRAIYRQTRIRSRGSVLLEDPEGRPFSQTFFPPARDQHDAGPSTARRMLRYAAEAGPLAAEAAERALARADVSGAAITHLVTCSCTGFAAPGFDFELIRSLDLPPTVARTHVGFMGCHAAFNALRVAAAFAAADPRATVLVACVELCSLHFQYGDSADQIVSNSIFADGAGAAVVRNTTTAGWLPGHGWRLAAQAAQILPESSCQMGWTIGDHGFEMTLSAEVPGTIGRALPAVIERFLAANGLDQNQIDLWAVHPGGPRVLSMVEASLGLSADRLAISRQVLADHGNMSSATILFILERLLGGHHGLPPEAAATAPQTCLAMAFGPGLTAELALFTRADEGLDRPEAL